MKRIEQIKSLAEANYPYDQILRNAFIMGARIADKTMVDNAIKWLKTQDEMIGISFQDDFIERFRDAMEE